MRLTLRRGDGLTAVVGFEATRGYHGEAGAGNGSVASAYGGAAEEDASLEGLLEWLASLSFFDGGDVAEAQRLLASGMPPELGGAEVERIAELIKRLRQAAAH